MSTTFIEKPLLFDMDSRDHYSEAMKQEIQRQLRNMLVEKALFSIVSAFIVDPDIQPPQICLTNDLDGKLLDLNDQGIINMGKIIYRELENMLNEKCLFSIIARLILSDEIMSTLLYNTISAINDNLRLCSTILQQVCLSIQMAYQSGHFILRMLGTRSLVIPGHAVVNDAGTYLLITHLPT